VGSRGRDDLGDVLGLMGRRRKRQLAGLLEAGVDPMARHRVLDRLEVLPPQPLDLVHLVRPARHPVLDSMGQRRVHEATVAPAGAEGDPLALEQHDLVRLLASEQSGPEPRQAGADDDQVGFDIRLQRRTGLRRAGLRQPERTRLGIRIRPADVSGDVNPARSARNPR
jgi:hypothetical protein